MAGSKSTSFVIEFLEPLLQVEIENFLALISTSSIWIAKNWYSQQRSRAQIASYIHDIF